MDVKTTTTNKKLKNNKDLSIWKLKGGKRSKGHPLSPGNQERKQMCLRRGVAKKPGLSSRDPGSSRLGKSVSEGYSRSRLGEKGHQAEVWNSWVWTLCLSLPLGIWAGHFPPHPQISQCDLHIFFRVFHEVVMRSKCIMSRIFPLKFNYA